MNSPTSRLADERLADEQLVALREMSGTAAIKGPLLRQLIDEIAARRAAESADAGHWVLWKPGDALPAKGVYYVTIAWGSHTRACEAEVDERCCTGWFPHANNPPIAYWSRPLPPPYIARQAGGDAP